jgi:hypothetical protein
VATPTVLRLATVFDAALTDGLTIDEAQRDLARER